MSVRMASAMAAMYGVCRVCPYDTVCDENPDVNPPPDAWGNRFQAADELERMRMRREAELSEEEIVGIGFSTVRTLWRNREGVCESDETEQVPEQENHYQRNYL